MSRHKMFYDWNKHLESVPNLPLPSLTETLARYLHYVDAIATKEERERTQEAVREFILNSGKSLHKELQRRREEYGTKSSYIKPFWDDMYLRGRYPVSIHSNPAVMMNFDDNHKSQSARAASLIESIANWCA